VIAHTFGTLAFILLGLGSLGIYLRLRDTAVERRALDGWWPSGSGSV
jgi:hypothetical protein